MKQYIVGIDLGTTNTVAAFAEPGADNIQLFEIEQLVAPGEVAARPLLPSVRYHPAPWELGEGEIRLPWAERDIAGLEKSVIGRLALDLGAQVPGKLVTSAKSWLSHQSVDRTAPILPWGAAAEVEKVSPLTASASYLAHVRTAWNSRFPDHPLEKQTLVLTVPASFDEGARTLTLEAARLAQLPNVRLLEEPQAAFYDWLFRHRKTLVEELHQTRLVLVCDVGGGTTDLTLIKVQMQNGEPRLTRIGVGNHLMLGGDNMDLALAHVAEARMAVANARLSAAQLSQLIQRCRAGKEELLAVGAPQKTAITLLGDGSKVIGGARSVELMRDEVHQLVVNGFFPEVSHDEQPKRSRAGIVEFGLPYAADPAITRHVAAFLSQHAPASREALGVAPNNPDLPVPDTLLLNGGVFRAEVLARRLESVLSSWRQAPLRVLQNVNPDVAVARGAVAYALARDGLAPKIGGGSARSYFLALDEVDQSRRGICVLPRGTEEGQEIRLRDRTFALRVGEPVRFHLISSVADMTHNPGDLTDLSTRGFVRLPPIATVVQSQGPDKAGDVPVQLTIAYTEAGTLEMHCVSVENAARRWRLEFQLRNSQTQNGEAKNQVHPRFAEAARKIERIFGARAQQVEIKEVKQLRPDLERILGVRSTWETPLLRELFGLLGEHARNRRRSADHERVWINLAGYCLRPGFGYPLDDWRVEQLWMLFEPGIQYVKESQLWLEWWTLWRRVAGGLRQAWQIRILDDIAYYLQPPGMGTYVRPLGPEKKGYDDMMRLAVSLEHLPVERKIELGNWSFERLLKSAEQDRSWWSVGRIGAREPFHGSAHNVVPSDIAEQWLGKILGLDWKKVEPAAFAATQIARMTGDRSRDLAPAVRSEVVERLTAINAPQSWISMVREVVALEKADEVRVFGESLPAGLKLIG